MKIFSFGHVQLYIFSQIYELLQYNNYVIDIPTNTYIYWLFNSQI